MSNIETQYEPVTIGERIKECRTDKKMKQEDLGNRVHVVRQTVSKWEKGEIIPPLETMLQLCNIFDCELSYLLCESDFKTKNLQGIAAYTGLSENAVHTLHRFKQKTDSIETLRLFMTDQFLSAESHASLFFLQLAKLYIKLDVAVDQLENNVNDPIACKYRVLDLADQKAEVHKAIDLFLQDSFNYDEIISDLKSVIEKGES